MHLASTGNREIEKSSLWQRTDIGIVWELEKPVGKDAEWEGLRVSQRNGKMNPEVCDTFCFCSPIYCLFLYKDYALLFNRHQAWSCDYFDQGKVSSTLICPFKAFHLCSLSFRWTSCYFQMGAVSHAHAM